MFDLFARINEDFLADIISLCAGILFAQTMIF